MPVVAGAIARVGPIGGAEWLGTVHESRARGSLGGVRLFDRASAADCQTTAVVTSRTSEQAATQLELGAPLTHRSASVNVQAHGGNRVPFPPQTVVEVGHYLARANKLFTAEEREEIVWLVANHPTAGDLIQGTGGVRKMRFAFGGRGKSGGARVIYFFHDEDMPIYLLTVFAKNQRANITAAERNALRGLTEALVAAHKEAQDG